MDVSKATLTRAVAVLAAGYLTVGMGFLLVQPGRTTSRVVFVAVVVGLGWVGAAGFVTGRRIVALAAAGGLAGLGFWQAVAWLFVLPPAVVLAIAALGLPADTGTAGENGPGTDGRTADGEPTASDR